MKECNECKQTLPLDKFHKHKGRKHSVTEKCKECRNTLIVEKRHGLEKAEKVIKSIENGPLRYYDSVYKDTEWDTCCSGRDCGCLGMPIDPEYFIYQDLKRARSYFQEKNKENESDSI